MNLPKLGPVIAIDGPAGTGKSSVTKRLADLLQYIHVDTGALYRAVAWASHEYEKNPIDVAHEAHLEFKRVEDRNPSNRLLINGKDITDFIRTPEVSLMASKVSAIPEVRAALLGLQRRLGCHGKAILEGRDIGTVVFPDADVKFFLSASIDERAKRRLAELESSGANLISFEELKKQIHERDQADMNRTVAPLKRAPDAIDIDTTQMTLDQVVEKMAQLVNEKVKG